MKQLILTFLFFFITLSYCNAQQIEIEKTFGGYLYMQGENQMTEEELFAALETNKEAINQMNEAFKKYKTSSIIGFVGGGVIGWEASRIIRGYDTNWIVLGVGVGLIGTSISLKLCGNKKARQSIELYNNSLNSTSYNKVKTQFNFIAGARGIGLSVNF